ncbi:MAG: uroporphyrinogen decarboxylase family protein [Fimbriimonadales bacterium]
MLHLHGYGELYADLLADAPAAVVCWSDRSTTLSLAEGKRLFNRCVMGGLNEMDLPRMCRERVFQQAQDALDSVGRRGFILAPGCSVPTDIDPNLLMAIREFALSASP